MVSGTATLPMLASGTSAESTFADFQAHFLSTGPNTLRACPNIHNKVYACDSSKEHFSLP